MKGSCVLRAFVWLYPKVAKFRTLLQRAMLALATIGLLFSSGINLIVIGLLGRMVDSFVTADHDEGRANLLSSVLTLFSVFVFGGLMTFLRAALFTIAGERVVLRLRKRLFASILEQDIAFFDETRTGELINRLADDCSVLQSTVTSNVSMALRQLLQVSTRKASSFASPRHASAGRGAHDAARRAPPPAQLFGSLVIIFFISWRLTLVMLAVVPIVTVGAVRYGRSQPPSSAPPLPPLPPPLPAPRSIQLLPRPIPLPVPPSAASSPPPQCSYRCSVRLRAPPPPWFPAPCPFPARPAAARTRARARAQ